MTKISSAMSILRRCMSSSISFTPGFHTSSSPAWPNMPTLMTIHPSNVNCFWTSMNCSLKRVLPQSVTTLYWERGRLARKKFVIFSRNFTTGMSLGR